MSIGDSPGAAIIVTGVSLQEPGSPPPVWAAQGIAAFGDAAFAAAGAGSVCPTTDAAAARAVAGGAVAARAARFTTFPAAVVPIGVGFKAVLTAACTGGAPPGVANDAPPTPEVVCGVGLNVGAAACDEASCWNPGPITSAVLTVPAGTILRVASC